MEWLEREKSQNRSEFDGDVILQFEQVKDIVRLQFKFRKNSAYKIVSKEEYIIVARDKNKIYFKEATSKNGYHLSNAGLNTKIFKVLLTRFPVRKEDLGEYNIEFDSDLGLHYICLDRKLEKTLVWNGRNI